MMKISTVADWTYNRLLRLQREGFWMRLERTLLIYFRHVMITLGDPIVHCNVAGVEMSLPLSHPLPLTLKHFPNFGSNLGRIAARAHKKYPDLTLVDIGANIGDSIAVLRKHAQFPILCIEGDPAFFPLLEENAGHFPDIQISRAFIGEKSGETNITIHRTMGTSHLESTTADGTHVFLKTLKDVVVEHPRFSHAKFIKIDTDGFDGKIIRGAVELLKVTKPILFFEYHPTLLRAAGDDGLSLFILLQRSGYQNMLIYDRTGEFMLSANVEDETLLEELHTYFADPEGIRHADICVFHGEDLDLFDQLRRSELEYFRVLHHAFQPIRKGQSS